MQSDIVPNENDSPRCYSNLTSATVLADLSTLDTSNVKDL